MKQHHYTIEVSLNGYTWAVVGRYKFIDQRREAMEELRRNGKWSNYIMRESFE